MTMDDAKTLRIDEQVIWAKATLICLGFGLSLAD